MEARARDMLSNPILNWFPDPGTDYDGGIEAKIASTVGTLIGGRIGELVHQQVVEEVLDE